MFFGGFQGLNAFHPAQIELNPHAPSLVITALDPYDQSTRADLLPGERLQLSYQDNDVSFHFTALDYSAPTRNQYAYKMDGVDKDWRQAETNRRADYANLRTGDYVLRVRASNSDGVWSEEHTVHISVTPPAWETWWFQGGALLALALGLLGVYRLRVRNIEAQRRQLQAQVEQRTAQLSETNVLLRQEMDERQRAEQALAQQAAQAAVAAERNRLARDMHDSVTQSLYSLTLLSAAGQRMIEAGDLSQVESNQARLSEISQQALQEMRLLVYELRPLALQSLGLVGALEGRLEAVERRAGINARLITNDEEMDAWPPQVEQELYRIAQEALNNALKHAGAGTVTVRIQAEDGTLALEISDDGRGFDPQSVSSKGGLGQASMRERAAKIGAHLTINSSPGAGTRIKILVPST
jgi:signal transduction histidine kinase